MADDEAAMTFEEALRQGINSFNKQRYFEAYDVWERRWSEEVGEGADLLQGLLQISVGFSKLGDDNPGAADKLLRKGMERIRPYAPVSFELDLEALLQSVAAWQQLAASVAGGASLDTAPAPPFIGPSAP